MLLRLGTHTVDCGLIIFDKDGTLVDLHASWGGWFAEVVQHFAAYIPPDELLQRFGWDAATARIRPETPMAIATVDEARAYFATTLYERGLGWTAAVAAARTAIEAVPLVTSPPVCPLQPVFEQLRAHGTKIAVVTSDDHAEVIRDLEPLGVLPYIDASLGGDAGIPAKPAPDAVYAVAARTGVPVERIVVVGDSLADLAMGRNAGVACTVGVLSGSGTREILAPFADAIVSSVCALLDG